MDAIDEIPYRYGSTNTYGGLRMMRTEFFSVANGDREDVPDVTIILTDGAQSCQFIKALYVETVF
jgi:collagen type VI alpha